ncbi:MFS transporter [Gilvimarinus agarilyticus]|uniref:MFS transporter n=1 Tax=Gilvimarinus agarilyticus TaxID=679259 RepID=UPI0005A05072|nr:MFS transporter [Gilvimarinus agarilyticus]
MNNSNKLYLSKTEKIAYASGDAATNFFFKFFQFFLFYYYTDSVGLSAGVIGTMFLASRILDMFTDPAMGILADRTRSRWGSYRPYLLFIAIPYGIFGYLMFLNPQFSEQGKLWYAFITYSLMMMAFTAINIPYAAMTGVMTPNSYERTVLSSYRFMGAFGGGLLLTLLARPLVKALGGGNEAEGFRITMALFAVISVLLFWVTFWFCKERVKPAITQKSSWKKDFSSLIKNRPWQILTLSFLIHGCYYTIYGAVTIHFFKYWVGDNGEAVFLIFDFSTLFLATSLLSSLVGAGLTKNLVRIFDKRSVIIGSALLNGVVMTGFYFVANADYLTLFTLQVINGLAIGPLPVLIWAMYADTADYGEHQYGHRNTGLIFSAALFGLKMGLAMGGAIAGWVLAAYGFEANAEQSERSLLGILLCFSLIPAALAFIKVGVLLFYPLRDKHMQDIEAALTERKGELHAPSS